MKKRLLFILLLPSALHCSASSGENKEGEDTPSKWEWNKWYVPNESEARTAFGHLTHACGSHPPVWNWDDQDLRIIKTAGLLERDYPEGSGQTLLLNAVANKRYKESKKLIEAGARADKEDATGYSILEYAKLKETALIKLLLDAGANPHSLCRTFHTTFLDEIFKALSETDCAFYPERLIYTAELFIAKGAYLTPRFGEKIPEYNEKDKRTQPLLVRMLSTLSPRKKGRLFLQNYDDPHIMDLLIAAGVDPNIQDERDRETVLHKAVRYGPISAIRAILAYTSPPQPLP